MLIIFKLLVDKNVDLNSNIIKYDNNECNYSIHDLVYLNNELSDNNKINIIQNKYFRDLIRTTPW